ncbi:MAG TPA: hypothetical protein VII90_02665 [Anaerolineales bacterium]
MKKRFIWIACVTTLVFSALACNSIPFLAPTPTPTATPTSTPTATPTLTPIPTLTPTPTEIPGITIPVTVDGVDLQFVSVTTASHWLVGSDDYTPNSSSDTFLVVTANVLTDNTAHSTLAGWDVTVNGDVAWSFLQSKGASTSITSATWVFVVDQSLTSFIINLPGGVDVPLDSLYSG